MTLASLVGACFVLVAAAGASQAGWRVVRVAGESMYPALYAGDIALVRAGRDVERGDVVLYRLPEDRTPTLHRVTGEVSEGFVTCGDANPIADMRPVPREALLGRLERVVPCGVLLERWHRFRGGGRLRD